MKQVYIVTKNRGGIGGVASIGYDGATLFEKNMLSTKLIEKLKEDLGDKASNFNFVVANENHEMSLNIRDGAECVLISPYLKGHVFTDGLTEDQYYWMNESELLHQTTDNILLYLQKVS